MKIEVCFMKSSPFGLSLSLPLHLYPLPENPALQLHSYDPLLFVHVAFMSHP